MYSEKIRQNRVSTVMLWTLVKSIAALLMVYYWEFGWVLLVLYFLYKIESVAAYQYLNTTEVNEHISRLNSQIEHLMGSSERMEEDLRKRIELLESKLYER